MQFHFYNLTIEFRISYKKYRIFSCTKYGPASRRLAVYSVASETKAEVNLLLAFKARKKNRIPCKFMQVNI